MAVFKCKMCGGDLQIQENESVAVCEYCGTKQTLPKLDDEKRIQLYDRANHFRRQNEFDKAMGIYEMILSDNKEDPEAYWGIVLCRYGIEYVEDPRTHKRIPTVNRAQFTSILEDKDYLSALQYADGIQQDVYKAEANTIDKIQKGILEISSKEEPFDVFICYKETDDSGERTEDSVYAQDIYTALTKEGFKVFFSRITLESKLGSAYEPYIFAALQSAKVMLVVGTSKENFNAVWVKNEWSRYLALIKEGKEKTIIPVYKNIDPYEMPEEFTYLQSQDMGKIGFMQDLVRGVRKLLGKKIVAGNEKQTQKPQATASIGSLLRRAALYLEDGDWENAIVYSNRVLDVQPENPDAYLAGLMAEFHCNKMDDLANLSAPFNQSKNYEKIMRFGDKELQQEICRYLENINYRVYEQCQSLLNVAQTEKDYLEIIRQLRLILDYRDVESQIKTCITKVNEIRENQSIKETLSSKMVALDHKIFTLKKGKDRTNDEKNMLLQNLREQQTRKKIVQSIINSYRCFTCFVISFPILIRAIISVQNDNLLLFLNALYFLALIIPIFIIIYATKRLKIQLPKKQKALQWKQAKKILKHEFSIEQVQTDLNRKNNLISALDAEILDYQTQKNDLNQKYEAFVAENPYLKDDDNVNSATTIADSLYENSETDPMITSAIEVVVEEQSASTTLLQRKLKISYARAARIMDYLEEQGIVGPYEGSQPRKVFLTNKQWNDSYDESQKEED